jgi:GNAT superfamily N-acetyltransferase
MPKFAERRWSGMNYRRATVADAPALAAMNWQLIRDEGHRNPMTVAELTTRMANWLAGEYEAILFEDSGQVVGYSLYRRESEYIYLRQFFVLAEHRRRGIGRAAIGWLRQHAWDGGRVRVEVLVGNASGIAFWRAVGFADYCLTLETVAGAPSGPAGASCRG